MREHVFERFGSCERECVECVIVIPKYHEDAVFKSSGTRVASPVIAWTTVVAR